MAAGIPVACARCSPAPTARQPARRRSADAPRPARERVRRARHVCRGGAPRGQTCVRRRRSHAVDLPRAAWAARAGRSVPGSSLRRSLAREGPPVHARRRRRAGAWHRRQHRHLLADREPGAPSSAREQPYAAGHHRRQQRHDEESAELRRLAGDLESSRDRRWCPCLDHRSLQPRPGRRNATRQRHLGQRQHVRDARRARHPRPHVHRRRRCARRGPRRPGDGHQLQLLATALRRRRRRGWEVAHDRRCALYDRRRHTIAVFRSRRRPLVRRRDSSRHRAAPDGQGHGAR